MSSRIALALFAVAGAGVAALQGASATQAQSYEVWEATPVSNGAADTARHDMSAQYSAAPAPAAPNCGQVVARFNQISQSRRSAARAFNARYGNMTLSSRKLTGFCSAYETNLSAMYDQVAEMNYLAETASAMCPARVPEAIRQQADATWADYSSGSARLSAECNYDAG